MEETFETESLPVLKKGSYNLDFLDDNACFNPFESKCKLSQSPPINSDWNENVNPFQTKSKLGQSPPISSDDNFNSFDNDSSKTRLSPLPFNKANDNEKNGNQTEDDMNNLSFDQKRYIEDQSLDQFADSRFNYEDENLELTNKNVNNGSDCNEERGSRLSMSDREQSFDSLEENSTPDRSIGHDIGFSLVEDHSPTDNVYDDFKDAENQDECISESNTFESELSEHGRQLNTDTTENAESLDLKTHSDELKELNSTEVEENARKEIEHQVNDVIDNLNCLESNPEKPFCFSDIAEPQNNEMFPVGQSTVIQQTEKNHPDLINDVSNSEVPSVCFEDGKSQENLELTEGGTLIEKEVKEEFSHIDAMDNETQKTDPCDDLSSSIVLSSPNLCEDSGLGDSIVTSESEDLDKVEDIKSEEGMDSPPVTPVSSNQDLTVSQKNDVGFEDEEYFQTNEALPEIPQALSADNDVSSFTDCFSTPDEALITGSPSDPHSIVNDNFQEISNKDSSSLEAGEESSISSGSVNLAEIPNPDELIEKTPPTTKPAKKKLKGKVLKKKNMQPKITNIIDRKDLDDDDIKDLIAGKKMSLATEISSNINEDASSSVDMIQVPPNKNSPSNAKPVSKSKSSKRTLPKISKNSDPESPFPPHMPTINGHHQMVVSEHSLDGGFSPTPVKCIPRLEKSLSSDSYPEMAPDFGVEDGDAQDIANEGCVPVSEVFNESTTWEMLEKFGDEGSFKDSERDQAPQSVYMKLEPGVGCSATSTGGHFLHSKGNQPITNGDKTARAIHEGNEYMQMTSSEPPSKTPSSKTHRHPAARVLDGKAGGGSTAMKKREIDNHDNVSVSQKEEKFDKDEKESDELEYQDAHDDFPLTLGDSWVEQVHNFTEIEDSSLGLSQDSLEGLSWSHTDNGLASDTPIPYGCCLNKSSLQTVDYDPDSDSGVAVDTSSPAHHATNGTESIVQLVPDPAQQTTSSSDPSQVLKYSQSEWNKMKQEQELEFQTRLLQKEKDWSKKLAEKERRLTDQEKRIMLLDDQTRNLKQSNEDMRLIVAEFEKTIAQLQAEKEKTTSASQESLENVLRERDQALEDLQSVETAFSDLHRRYEKTKNVVEGFKKNEDILKKCVQDYQLKIKRAEQKLLAIRQQAEEKLEQANTEIEKLRRSTSAEIAKLEAALKKSDIQVQALERTVDQKTLENQELTAICDELIAKVGDVS